MGLTCEINSFIENLNKEYNLTKRIPELVEKKDPPTIVKIKKKKEILFCESSVANPILEILLAKAKKNELKL